MATARGLPSPYSPPCSRYGRFPHSADAGAGPPGIRSPPPVSVVSPLPPRRFLLETARRSPASPPVGSPIPSASTVNGTGQGPSGPNMSTTTGPRASTRPRSIRARATRASGTGPSVKPVPLGTATSACQRVGERTDPGQAGRLLRGEMVPGGEHVGIGVADPGVAVVVPYQHLEREVEGGEG